MTEQWPGEGDLLNERYRLIEPIGMGGMAVVWRARDESLERLVAIKVLNTELAVDRRIREMVRREARTAAQLTHPQATPVYDYGEILTPGGRPGAYLVMQLLDGEPLDERLAAGPLPWTDAARIGEQVARVLAATHGCGVIHGDISPGNVVLTPDGVRVIDFGISETIVDTGTPGIGGMFGTPPYMAPERLSGEPTQLASDVYALGALLFEMLTGAPPHPAITWADIGEAHRSNPYPSLDGVPELPRDIAEVCLQCLDPDPANRPAASEVADDLAAALAHPAMPPRRWWKSNRHRFVLASAMAATAVVVMTGFVVNCWPALIRAGHEDTSSGPPKSSEATQQAAASDGGRAVNVTPSAHAGTGTAEPAITSSVGTVGATPTDQTAGTMTFTVESAVTALYGVIDSAVASESMTLGAADTLRTELRNLTANRTRDQADSLRQVEHLRRKVADGTRDGSISTTASHELSAGLDDLANAIQQEATRG